MAKNSSLGSDFSRIWSASLITNLADGVLKLAAPLLAVSLTEDPVLIGLLSALSLLPWLFFAIPIGVYVDRTDRRRALIQGNILRSIVGIVLAFAIAEDFINIWILLSAIFFIGICEVLVDTTSQSVLPQILDRSEFEKGNSRLQISEVIVAQFVGSPLSGFLYAIAIGLPFFFSTAGFFVAALVIAVLPFKKELSSINPHDVKKEKMGILGDIKFALFYLSREIHLCNCRGHNFHWLFLLTLQCDCTFISTQRIRYPRQTFRSGACNSGSRRSHWLDCSASNLKCTWQR